jgi:tripartite-type tricarboxylate transporter receptor subunit TctC
MVVRYRALARILAGVAFWAASSSVAAIPDEADALSGKKVTLGIPSSAGGAYDGYSRLLARHFGRHLPGNPSVIPQNVPAGGGMVLVNQMFNVAPRDGTYFGMLRASTLYEELYGNPAVKFEGRKLTWVGNLNSDYDTCVTWHNSGITSVADLYKREVIVGSAGAGAMSASIPIIYNEFLGTKFKVILGYTGTPQRILAMESGELQANCGFTTVSLRATAGQAFRDGKLVMIAQGGMTKDPAYPDLPNMLDEAKTPEARSALEFVFLQGDLGRPYAAPPGLPADSAKRLRNAFDATARDGEFLAEAEKLKLDINAIGGAAMEASVERLYATPRPIVERVGAAMTRSAN